MKLSQQRRRFREFKRLEQANLDALSALHARMRIAMECGRRDLLRQMRHECERLNAQRYEIDALYADVSSLVEVSDV